MFSTFKSTLLGFAVPISRPLYIEYKSALIISKGKSFDNFIESLDLPEAVGREE